MRHTKIYHEIRVIGKIWMSKCTCAQFLNPSDSDVDNMSDDRGEYTRESVEHWISRHAGDFQSVEDFYANLAIGDKDVEFDWANEESEGVFNDCMYPMEVEK